MHKTFAPSHHQPSDPNTSALCFVFHEESMLVYEGASGLEIPSKESLAPLPLNISQEQYLGIYDDKHCYAVSVETHQTLPDAFSFENFRRVGWELVDEDMFFIASRARQILFWDKRTQYCGQCAEKTELSEDEHAKVCTACDTIYYFQVSPVVMVLIKRGKEILLARSPHFPEGLYSVLAGFVEPGETAEQAAAREVYEEVGIEIKNIQYVASQPWPFPSNLMLGFTADYNSGDIVIDDIEICDANWYTKQNLPRIPTKISLARHLIDQFIR